MPSFCMRLAVLALLLAVCRGGYAAVFCAADSTLIDSALTTASNNGESDEIRIVSATHSGGFFFQSSEGHNLTITGGWNSSCTSQIRLPALTVLHGGNNQRVLNINQLGTAGDVVVENLTFTAGDTTGVRGGNTNGAGLEVIGAGFSGNIAINHCIFHNNQSPTFGGGLSASTSGRLIVRNSLFFENTALNNGAASLTVNLSDSYIINNTVADNHATSAVVPVGGLRMGGSTTAYISNNIFWANDSADLRLQADNVTRFNTIEELAGGLGPGSENNLAVNPQFAGAGDYHLTTLSPAVNGGINDPVGGLSAFDLAGRARIFGVIVDQGVYEFIDILFGDGFELLF